MRSFWSVLLRTGVVFVIFLGVQYWIPYYLLAGAGLVAGFFMLKTSDDRPLALGVLIASVAFGIYAFVIEQFFKNL